MMHEGIWVFGDHRNYYQDRVTLQLLARAREMAAKVNTYVGVVVIGADVDEYCMEYTAHGAEKVFLVEHESLQEYSLEGFTGIITDLVREFRPEILLVPGSDFGRLLAPKVAARLGTGASSDCIALDIDDEGFFVQMSAVHDGSAVAEILGRDIYPHIATVRPGVYRERPHDYNACAELVRVEADEGSFRERVRVLSSTRESAETGGLEEAPCVVCAGNGIGRGGIRRVRELAALISAEIGCTRPLVEKNFMTHDRLIGQTGKAVRPELLIVAGASGATQFTAAIGGSKCIVAVNRDQNAAVFGHCDIGIVGDADSVMRRLIARLKK
ncbi:MAG TPA: electron transfer flavoprotein subunit alpha/FixB family protein [Spirochaetota bacterium]|nr:electron transfer flavoprotein subunit alpha/FixB family protein [Spirochaetota bacterium]